MCHLRLLGTRAGEPDVARAWRLRDSVVALAPEGEREFRTLSAQMAVAAVLARANLSDSARRVVERSRGSAEIDPSRDLMEEEAFVQTLLGDNQAAFRALKTYWTANPTHQKDLAQDAGWKFEALRADPAWTKTVGGP
jgi:hypothetical protein